VRWNDKQKRYYARHIWHSGCLLTLGGARWRTPKTPYYRGADIGPRCCGTRVWRDNPGETLIPIDARHASVNNASLSWLNSRYRLLGAYGSLRGPPTALKEGRRMSTAMRGQAEGMVRRALTGAGAVIALAHGGR
jgi:hypothetical protein